MDWWQSFFDATYFQVWGGMLPPEASKAQAEGLWQLLGLEPGRHVLDAPASPDLSPTAAPSSWELISPRR